MKNSERSRDVHVLPTIPVRATPSTSRKIALGKVGLFPKVEDVNEPAAVASRPIEICRPFFEISFQLLKRNDRTFRRSIVVRS